MAREWWLGDLDVLSRVHRGQLVSRCPVSTECCARRPARARFPPPRCRERSRIGAPASLATVFAFRCPNQGGEAVHAAARVRSASGRRLRKVARARPSAARRGQGSSPAFGGRAEDGRRVVPTLRREEAELHPVERQGLAVLEVLPEALTEPPDPCLAGQQECREPAGLGVVGDRRLVHGLEGGVTRRAPVHPGARGAGGRGPGREGGRIVRGRARASAMLAAIVRTQASVSAASARVNTTRATRPVRR